MANTGGMDGNVVTARYGYLSSVWWCMFGHPPDHPESDDHSCMSGGDYVIDYAAHNDLGLGRFSFSWSSGSLDFKIKRKKKMGFFYTYWSST